MKTQGTKDVIEAVGKVTTNPLIAAAKEFKNPSVRFILIAAIFIMATMASIIIFFFTDVNNVKKQAYDNVVVGYNQVQSKLSTLQYSYDSLKDAKTKALYEQAIEFLQYKDSMNNELRNINKTLTSK